MRYHLRLGCGQPRLHRLRAQWVARHKIRRLGHGVELVPQPDPLVGLSVGHCDVVLVPGPALAVLPQDPALAVAAWLPAPDGRMAWCAPAGENRLRNPAFPARVACWHAAVAAQWQLLQPSHQILIRPAADLPGSDALDGWLVPAEALHHQGWLADATGFPALIPPPALQAYALLVTAANHALRDQLALLTDTDTAATAQLCLALADAIPFTRRPYLAAHVNDAQLVACLATPGGIRYARGAAAVASVEGIAGLLLTGD